jgi:hypothetical protein
MKINEKLLSCGDIPWVCGPRYERDRGLGLVAPRKRARTAFRRRKVLHSGEQQKKKKEETKKKRDKKKKKMNSNC